MFAARYENDNWILCIRRGRAIYTYHNEYGKPVKIIFNSQAKAKACADELNESYLIGYDNTFDRENGNLMVEQNELVNELMINIIGIVDQYRLR